MLEIKEGYSDLAGYLTARLLADDAVWDALFMLGESSTVKDIVVSLNETRECKIAEGRVEWLLEHCPQRFRRADDNKWELTAWHLQKRASFPDKVLMALRLSGMPLATGNLAYILNISSQSAPASLDIIDRLLGKKADTFERLGPYWLLKEWVDRKQTIGNANLLDLMVVRASDKPATYISDLHLACIAQLHPLRIAIGAENLIWSLRYHGIKANFKSIFGSKLLRAVCAGNWVLSEFVPVFESYFMPLDAGVIEDFEAQLKELSDNCKVKSIESGLRNKRNIIQISKKLESQKILESPATETKDTRAPSDLPLQQYVESGHAPEEGFIPDDEQRKVIYARGSCRQLVLACPGSGKTEAVARKLAHLVSNKGGLKPRQILVLSFSRSAVKVLLDRIRGIIDEDSETYEDLRHVSVRTFDSWTFRSLRHLGYSPGQLLQNSGSQDSYTNNIKLLIYNLRNKDAQRKLVGDGDKLGNIRHIIVDECQDLSGPRAELVRELLTLLAPASVQERPSTVGFTLLGDMNQAIYDWMMQEYPGSLTSSELIKFVRTQYKRELQEIELCTNYRSNTDIIKLVNEAAKIIGGDHSDVSSRIQKIIQLAVETGGKYSFDDLGKFLEKPDLKSSFAVLCRRNDEAIYVANRLQTEYQCDNNVRYILDIGDPPESLPPWIAFLLGKFKGLQITLSHFMKLCDKYRHETGDEGDIPDAAYAWRLLVRACQQEDDSKSINLDDLREKLLWRDALPDDEGLEGQQIVFTNIHRSKGQQFDSVVLVNSDSPDHEDEDIGEAKVVYVGISRAREYIFVLDNVETKKFFPKFENTAHPRLYRYEQDNDWLRMLEIGIPGDIDSASFVNISLHGSEEEVKTIQSFLFEKHNSLIGQAVVLLKRQVSVNPPRIVYDIALPRNEHDMFILGSTTKQLTLDLWNLKHEKAKFPDTIEGLRIAQVTTIVGTQENLDGVAEPWRTSRLWLGVNIHGIGHFRFGF